MLRCKLVCGVLAVSCTGVAIPAGADPTIAWQPITSTGPFALDGNTITVPGGGVEVTLELRLSGWGDAPGNPDLGAYQGTVDADGYDNGVGASLSPKGWPGSPEDGAFIDLGRDDFPFKDLTPVPGVVTATLDYEWGCSAGDGAAVDGGGVYYGGTLILVIPPGAGGTYTIGWNPSAAKTFLNDQDGADIPGLVRLPATIQIPLGRCCSQIGPGTSVCSDNLSETQCDDLTAPRHFLADEACSDCGCPDCGGVGDCNDYDACTSEACDSICGCQYTLLYDPETECCNAADGSTAPRSDNNDCTFDLCIRRCTDGGEVCYAESDCAGGTDRCRATGEVDHWIYDEGQVCDHPNDCIINDHCDGAGTCVGFLPEDLSITCDENDDCPGSWFCNPFTSLCDCRLWTPNDARKNRYVSFYPDNGGANVAFQIGLTASAYFPGSSGTLGWVGPPDGNDVSRIVADSFFSNAWPEVVHVGDCQIVPMATYEIRSTADGVVFTDPFVASTIAQPPPKYWGDVVGSFTGTVWTAPNGVVNMDDVLSAVQRFQQLASAPPLTWVDVDGEVPNTVVNMTDIQQVVQGFKGEPYPFSDPAGCP